MASDTWATPGVERGERSVASRSCDVACTPSLPPSWTRKTGSLGSKSGLVGNALMLEHLVRTEKTRAGALTGGTVPGVWPASFVLATGVARSRHSGTSAGASPERDERCDSSVSRFRPVSAGLAAAADGLQQGVDDARVVLVAEAEVDPLDG